MQGIFSRGLTIPYHFAVAVVVAGALWTAPAQAEPELRTRLWDNVEFLQDLLRNDGVDIGDSTSQVIPIMIRDDDKIFAIGEDLPNGAGRFLSAELRPRIVVSEGCDLTRARELHDEIHHYCFIARSVKFPVSYAPVFETQ